MRNVKHLTLAVFLSMCACSVASQELTFGDSTAADKIRAKTSSIYENSDKTSFLLSSQSLQEGTVTGTSITVHSKRGVINRIITISFTPKGQLSAEWYFDNNSLIFAFHSFEYFAEYEPEDGWRNFKGISGWETRYYFEDDKLVYHKHRGRQEKIVEKNIDRVLHDAGKILSYANGQIKD